jgi:two-component system sensor histidine kinase KdpD
VSTRINERRPDPDALLARVKQQEAQKHRGKLKVFLGAAAGVGKTYAMLEAAQERRGEGVDVVVGWVETHGRPETERLLKDLEVLPPRLIEYRGVTLREFDLDAALARRPTLILVDELAHTNATGSRHVKRWQDVIELLDAGINVYTTLNVQHVESLNDVVAQITTVVVRETVPDSLLDQAEEVKLIDLPPDDLLQRLKEGKVYVAPQAEEAARNFFRKGNLIALRELALQLTAERVDEQMQVYMRDHAIGRTWPTTERIMVCVSPGLLGAKLVRAGRRLASRLRAEWLAVSIETPAHAHLSEAERDRLAQMLRLAERLGGQAVTLSGQNVIEEVLAYARARNVSKIIVGKPGKPRWRDLLFGSLVDRLITRSGEIDVYVISSEQEVAAPRRAARRVPRTNWRELGWTIAMVVSATALGWLMFPYFELSNIIMVYLLGVVIVAPWLSRPFTILASVLSVAAFNFFFVPPYFTFAVADKLFIVTFAIMLVVAIVIGSLTLRIRQQADAARHRERRTAALYDLSRELASTGDAENLLRAAVRHISEVFASRVAILVRAPAGGLVAKAAHPAAFEIDVNEGGVSQWVYEHGQMAGLGTETLPGARTLYVPLIATRGSVGVLGVQPLDGRAILDPEQLHLLETFANQTALALERAALAEEAQRAQVDIEAERLRNALLSSVSHDLRTPLTSIAGAASTLLEGERELDPGTRRDLTQAIHEEAGRLNRLVNNLLDMGRLESGAAQVRREWHPLEEVVGAAIGRLERRLAGRRVTTDVPADLPLVSIDGVLIEQVLINLLDNAIRYTPPGSPIEISARLADGAVTVEIADRGPGLPPGSEQRVFDKFYQAGPRGTRDGVGLGLPICRAIIEAHGGRIWAANRAEGGVAFRFTLPLEGSPPEITPEDVTTLAE